MPGAPGGEYPKFAVIITMAAPDGNKITFTFIEFADDSDQAKELALGRFAQAKSEGTDVYSDRAVRM